MPEGLSRVKLQVARLARVRVEVRVRARVVVRV